MKSLGERLQKFGLSLSRQKTAVLEFGRFAWENRTRRGEGKPETVNFLGFTHYLSKTRDGRFSLRVKTAKVRMSRALISMNTFLKWLNRRGGKKSFNWEGFEKYLTFNPLPKPKLTYAIYNTW